MEHIPIIKIGGFLLVPIQVDIYNRLALTFLQDDLTKGIVRYGSKGVLIDISSVDMVDSFIGRMLGNIASIPRVLDAHPVITGMRPSVAITMTKLGLSLKGVKTALNVDQGIEFLSAMMAAGAEVQDHNQLYTEIDEKSNRIRSESDERAYFFSGMSHELRTPINSVLSLSRLLIDRVDGDLTKEQERQVFYIKAAAESLSNLVNDLLDLSKIQAGKITENISDFTVEQVMSALNGMIKPLLSGSSVALVIEETEGIPILHSDEGKLSQILRNLTSNAIKFTETGEVRVSARLDPEDMVVFSVADTGIGIAAEDIDRIFEKYAQVPTRLQAKAKGTGLGLPLSKRLTEFLGGSISVVSTPGIGSTFSVEIPVNFSKKGKEEKEKKPVREALIKISEEKKQGEAYERKEQDNSRC